MWAIAELTAQGNITQPLLYCRKVMLMPASVFHKLYQEFSWIPGDRKALLCCHGKAKNINGQSHGLYWLARFAQLHYCLESMTCKQRSFLQRRVLNIVQPWSGQALSPKTKFACDSGSKHCFSSTMPCFGPHPCLIVIFCAA